MPPADWLSDIPKPAMTRERAKQITRSNQQTARSLAGAVFLSHKGDIAEAVEDVRQLLFPTAKRAVFEDGFDISLRVKTNVPDPVDSGYVTEVLMGVVGFAYRDYSVPYDELTPIEFEARIGVGVGKVGSESIPAGQFSMEWLRRAFRTCIERYYASL
jgi:hypothetical protein